MWIFHLNCLINFALAYTKDNNTTDIYLYLGCTIFLNDRLEWIARAGVE